MSQTEVQEPVEVTNKYDAVQLKNAVDDEIARFYTKEQHFKQSHVHTDIKLFLGYVSCLVAGAAFYYEYTTSFTEAIKVTTMCLFVYWTLQAISFGYYFFVEQSEVFAGSQKLDGKVTGTLQISGKLDKFSPKYELTFNYTDKSTGKSATYKVEPNVATWFTTKGVLVNEAMDRDLANYITVVKSNLHQN